MQIIGPDELIFGVDDIKGVDTFLKDYGLAAIGSTDNGGRYEALDGTGLTIRKADDSSLPPRLPTTSMLRKTIYGVVDQTVVDEIAAELGRDREVKRFADGSIEALDDLGFLLGFQKTVRRPLILEPERVNAPGAEPLRLDDDLGIKENMPCLPRTLSHIVYFVPDVVKAEKFYVERLNFRCTDRFTDVGPFLQPAGNRDHHTLFLIQTPPHMQGMEHMAFHLQGPTELMVAGRRFHEKGYQTFWGPGRHVFGSNWFWYFASPLGVNFEYDADMDLHSREWQARAVPVSADRSQAFLCQTRDKWAPIKDGGKV